MSAIFAQVHRFDCSCGRLVALRFSQLSIGENNCCIEIWHKDLHRRDIATEFSTVMVGRNLRVMLADTGCESYKWFAMMGYKE